MARRRKPRATRTTISTQLAVRFFNRQGAKEQLLEPRRREGREVRARKKLRFFLAAATKKQSMPSRRVIDSSPSSWRKGDGNAQHSRSALLGDAAQPPWRLGG